MKEYKYANSIKINSESEEECKKAIENYYKFLPICEAILLQEE